MYRQLRDGAVREEVITRRVVFHKDPQVLRRQSTPVGNMPPCPSIISHNISVTPMLARRCQSPDIGFVRWVATRTTGVEAFQTKGAMTIHQ